MAIDPVSASLGGPEWGIDGLEPLTPAPEAAPGQGQSAFGGMLTNAMADLSETQTQAADASRALATGQANDPTAVVVAVERAQLAMQLASQLRNRGVEAAQEIFRTQV